MRLRTVVAAALVLVVALGAGAWFSPVLSVRSVQVQGVTVVSPQQVRDAAAIPAGTPLLQVDLGAAARRVAAIPRVATAQVDRTLPSGVRITVVERTPVAWVTGSGGSHLLDADGFDFATQPPPAGLPELGVPTPGVNDPRTVAALSVLTMLPPPLREQVVRVSAVSPSAVELTLGQGRTVRWGGVEAAARKAAVLSALLTQPGRVYDVSSPSLPTVR